MKKIVHFILAFSLISCVQETTKSKIKNQEKIESYTQKPVCRETQLENHDAPQDPIIIKSCLWKGYKFNLTGTPDYKGRYSYQ